MQALSPIGFFGIVGQASNTITNVDLVNENVTGGEIVGGLAGEFFGNATTVTNAYTTGTVTGFDGANEVGGLAGLNDAAISGSNSSDTINETLAGGSLIGGLIGENGGSISNSNFNGAINLETSGNSDVGGIVGENEIIIRLPMFIVQATSR